MQIAFHIGANCTDEDRLLKSTLKNADILLQNGIAVPGPGKYRKLIREAIDSLAGQAAPEAARDVMLDTIIEDDEIDRLLLSNDNFLTIPKRIFDRGTFYHQAERKIAGLHTLFEGDEISLFLGIRHPASFLQETATRAGVDSLAQYLGVLAPTQVRWSDVIARIKLAAPATPLYVWCNEDTPLIWEELLRLFSGLAPEVPMVGQLDVLAHAISPDGLKQTQAKLTQIPADDLEARQNLIADAFELHALPDLIEDHIELPELDTAMVDAISAVYEDDLSVIAQMDGVELILPFD